MPHDNRRAERVAERIREETATFLAYGAKDPRLIALVTVTAVDVTPDLRHARIFVSLMGTESERASTFEGLQALAGHLRSRLGRPLGLRFSPEIEFTLDQSVERAGRIETLLEQLRQGQLPADEDPLD